MRVYGEIRAYFIGGSLSYMISTTPKSKDELSISWVFGLTPLDHLRDQPWTNPVFCPAWEREKGREELTSFLTKTYNGLVEAHGKRLKEYWSSDLRVFCRIDVSIVGLPNGGLEYFVNEIATSHSAGLFLSYCESEASTLALDFATVLRGWIAVSRSRRSAAA
ncbi:hypothetical protein FPV67DRAFT_1430325 [Lyophyllum atratum]|nr:hypothetical protein FPV67DRAFT_1430325 [Lyophyllum atratum]